MNPQRYPIGIQTFSELREGGYLYVDKTDLVYQMANGNAKYIFLSRPRRFGKSLLVSTLMSYFEGKKELFDGLAMEKLEKDWTKYPVLYFSMNDAKHADKEDIVEAIMSLIDDCEHKHGVKAEGRTTNIRLKNLVHRVYEKIGQKVVVLIDEYDAPLLDVVHEEENLPILRNVMRNFYSPLKSLDPYLRFVFLTGITKFSQLSIFSELNNIQNISRLKEYASLCGITEEEMLTQLRPGIEGLTHAEGLSYEETVEKLRQTYGGHRFAWPSPNMYNPYCLLRALDEKKVGNYWFDDDLKAYLKATLEKYDAPLKELENEGAGRSQLYVPMEMINYFTPILFQMGLLTIKDYEKEFCWYTLGIPNEEARSLLKTSPSLQKTVYGSHPKTVTPIHSA